MKHPFWDRVLLLLCALVALMGAALGVAILAGKISVLDIDSLIKRLDLSSNRHKAFLVGGTAFLALIGFLLVSVIVPNRKKRSSNFAIQRNENGMVRISLKALESLVAKCLSQHGELKVVTSSLFSDEESIRVDVHIALQSDISMPLAISALQKQIKRYVEACSGVMVQEVRIFVDSTMPVNGSPVSSPYLIPEALLKPSDESTSEGSGLSEVASGIDQETATAEDTEDPKEEEPSAPDEQIQYNVQQGPAESDVAAIKDVLNRREVDFSTSEQGEDEKA